MGNGILYRHNIMSIQSIEEFISIRGGFNNHLRDVYFIRATGVPGCFTDIISNIDEKMRGEMAQGRSQYMRLKKLPYLSDIQDSKFYSNGYDGWKADGSVSLRNISLHGTLGDVISDAIQQIITQYQRNRTNVSESMVRNFMTKIIFWFDTLMKDLISDWNERAVIKIVAENVLKEQEYLFYYFLTLLGCDVLLLEYKQDIDISETLKSLSSTIVLGDFQDCQLPEYVPHAPVKQENDGFNPMAGDRGDCGSDRHHIKMNIPEKRDRKKRTAANQPAVSQRTVLNAHQTESIDVSETDRSFEELAQLASSIVMISIHNKHGEVIGTGSGIMIGEDGYILTNNHVASGGRYYSVRIEDDEENYQTDEVIKYNNALDLAVVRIQRRLRPLPIYRGGKKLVRGQKVVAIGSPLGLFNSISDGIISGFRRIDDIDMIQFTAPISPGSSGGAVLNMQGEVIGISTAGINSGQNINLAVGYEYILMFAGGLVSS